MILQRPGRFGLLVCTCCAALAVCGCSNSRSGAEDGSQARTPAAAHSNPPANGGARSKAAVTLPVPPGIDAQRLMPREAGDAKASLALDEALGQLASGEFMPQPRSAAPPSEDVLRETTRLYLAAREMTLEGRYFDSIRSLEQALKLDPGAVSCMRLMAENYLSTIGPARALRLYEDILSLEPDDLEALLRLGSAAWQRRDVNKAAGLLGRAYALLKDEQAAASHADIWFLVAHDLGQVLLAEGYDRAGVSVWRALIQRLPQYPPESAHFQAKIDRLYRVAPEMWRDLGDAYCRLQRYDEAVEVYSQALGAARVSDQDMLPRLIWALSQAGRTPEAIDALLKAIDDPKMAGALELVALFRDSPQAEALATALRGRLAEQPGELRYVQAIAGLLPPERSDEVILEFLGEHGGDAAVLRDLLPWAVQRLAPSQPVRLIITLAQESSDIPDSLLDELVALTDDPRRFLEGWDQLPKAMRDSLEGQLVRVGLLLRDYQYDQARTALDALLARHPRSTAGLLSKATVLLVLNLSDEAIDVLKATPGQQSDSAELVYDRAMLLAQVGEVDAGLALLDELQAKRGESIDEAGHLRRKARLLTSAGRAREAAAALRGALEVEPGDAATFGALIRLYGYGGPLQDSTEYGSVVRALYAAAPQSREFRMLRAEQDAGRGRFDDAIAAYQALLAEDITDSVALEGLVKIWLAAGRASEASQWIATQRINRPGDRRLRDAWLRTLIADQRGGEAVEVLRAAVAKRPQDFASYIQLESALKSVGREDEARQVIAQRWSHQPESVTRSLALAQLAIEQDLGESALANLRHALELASEHLDRHVENITALASRLASEALRAQALELVESIGLQAIAKQVSAPPAVFIASATAMVELDRPLQGIIAFIEAVSQIDPEIEFDLTAVCAVSLGQHDRLDDGCALSDRWLGEQGPIRRREAGLAQWRLVQCAIRDEPQRAINLVRRAHEPDGDGSRAYESMQILDSRSTAGERDGQSPAQLLAQSLYLLAGAFSSEGHDASQEMLLEEALAVDPDHAMANNDLGYSLADRNVRLEEAEQMLVKATKAEGNNSAVLDSLGWVRYKLGKLENPDDEPREIFENAAIPLLEEAVRLRLEDRSEIDTTVILDHLGDAYWRAGQEQRAMEIWQRSVRTYDEIMQLNAATVQQDDANATIEFYRKYFGETIEMTRTKIEAAKAGKKPPVAASPGLDKN